jgi:hypothetical protein
MYAQEELMPGIKRSGEKVEWDGTESNEYLYATTDRETAVSQGFASAMEKVFPVRRFRTEGRDIHIFLEGKHPTPEQLKKLTVNLYTIRVLPQDQWRKNNNKVNGLDTEWTTQQTITSGIESRETIDVPTWLNGRTIKFFDHVDENPNSHIVQHTPLTKYFFKK